MRPARAAVFAAVCVVLTAAGHSLAEGRAVSATAVAIGFVVVFAAALAGGRRERSLGAITVGLLVGQAGLHELFVHLDADSPHGPVMHAGMAMHGGWTMTLAHLGAGLIAGWWLWRGERATWRLLARTRAAAVALLHALRQLAEVTTSSTAGRRPATVRTHAHPEPGTATCALLVTSAPRRGPPGHH